MDWQKAETALDRVEATISLLTRVKRAMQKAIAENNERELQILSQAVVALNCQLTTGFPRYYVDGTYCNTYTEALAECERVNADRAVTGQVRIVDILQL